MKRILSIALLITILFSSFGMVSFASSDYSGHWSEDIITSFIKEGIISGDEQGNVRPDAYILRSEFVKIVNRYYGFTKKADSNFSDVSPEKWYAEEFLIAKKAGYITGDNFGNATPEKNITRAEVCVILARLLKLDTVKSVSFADEADIPAWAKDAILKVAGAGYIKGYEDGSIKAQDNITKAEATVVISRTEKSASKPDNSTTDNQNDNQANDKPSIGGIAISGGSGGGGGGGGASRPSGTVTPVMDIRHFDNDTYTLELIAKSVTGFEFYINVANNSYTYNNVSYSVNNDAYIFSLRSIIMQTMQLRGVSGEEYTISINGITLSGNINKQVFKGVINVDLPSVTGLKAEYNNVNGAYTPNAYKLEWNTTDNTSAYIYSVYNTEENNASPVFEDSITKENIAEGAQSVSVVLPLSDAWGNRDNLFFVVKAKDELSGIIGNASEKKYLLLDAPEISKISYLSDDKYEIQYEKDAEATYMVKVGNEELSDGKTYTALTADTIKAVTLKAYYQNNETKASNLDFDFSFGGGNGSDEPYLIHNGRHFKNIANKLSGKYILANDIALGDDYISIENFAGILDGNGFAIDLGYRVSGRSGLFASIAGGSVKNLTVKGDILYTGHAGGIAGTVPSGNSATVTNCINYVNVSSSGNNNKAGGFIGDTSAAGEVTLTDCNNYGTIYAGTNAYAGGIIGACLNSKLINCANYGPITVKSAGRCGGGLVAIAYGVTVEGCANFGNVVNSENGTAMGGIAGLVSGNNTLTVTNSLNAGTVVNGITGTLGKDATKASVAGFINVGQTTIIALPATTGTVKVTSSYYLKDSGEGIDGAIAKTSAELKNLTIDGFAKGDYAYPLPTGLKYMPGTNYVPDTPDPENPPVVEPENPPVEEGIKISTAEEFKNIANNLSQTYILTKDITLDSSYTPIENFAGTFDGKGYTIDIGSRVDGRNGIFASIAGGTVKNLTVKGSILYTGHAGGIAATVLADKTATFINCNNLVNVVVSGTNNYAGGLVGYAYQSGLVTFTNCNNYAEVYAGTNALAGGILGIGSGATFDKCANYGTVKVKSSGKNGGGFIGFAYKNSSVINCVNFGNVINEQSGINMGGIAGGVPKGATLNVINSFNAGKVVNGVAGALADATSKVNVSGFINVGATTNVVSPAGTVNVVDLYYLEGSGTAVSGATSKTSAELQNLSLNGFIKGDYTYPLPEGITYRLLQ